MKLIGLDQASAQAWRNGGGTTRELFTWPASGPWQLRISVADINADGPFSAFAGVDRWFAVAEGDGVELQFGDLQHRLRTDSAPLFFDGAAAPDCTLLGGATRDLNLMCQRDAGRAQMLRVQAGADWISTAPLRALFTTTPLQLLIDGALVAELPAWTLALGTQAAQQRWCVVGAADSAPAWWMAFSPHAIA
jgi:environmental stress-induced protein Ves